MFTVWFPDDQTIKDWEVFNPISLRSVKAKIKVDAWSGAIGAKAELEESWFKVRGIDKRSKPTLGYVGSLVGIAREVDKSTLHRADYVRIEIAAREVAKVPEVVEGAIETYLYDFFFERELEMGKATKAIEIKVAAGKGGEDQPSLKKPMTNQETGESGQGSKQAGYEKDGASKEVDKAAHLMVGLSSIDELIEMDGQNFRHSF
jgi:hypothetical protein